MPKTAETLVQIHSTSISDRLQVASAMFTRCKAAASLLPMLLPDNAGAVRDAQALEQAAGAAAAAGADRCVAGAPCYRAGRQGAARCAAGGAGGRVQQLAGKPFYITASFWLHFALSSRACPSIPAEGCRLDVLQVAAIAASISGRNPFALVQVQAPSCTLPQSCACLTF